MGKYDYCDKYLLVMFNSSSHYLLFDDDYILYVIVINS